MTDRELLQQALDDLINIKVEDGIDCVATILALRALLANEFNPDWDRIEALRESLREHTAEIRRLHELNADLIDALQFCSGTSYISDAHRVAEETLAKVEGK